MVSENLRHAYNFHRARAVGNAYPAPRGQRYNPASEALKAARAAVAAGRPQFASSPWGKQYATPGDGLRLVGRVAAECGGRNGYFSDDGGWYTDPDGETFRDGTGLCYGVVYQLPARRGHARFIAGHQFGGHDGGPSLDRSNVYIAEKPEAEWISHDAADCPAVRKACHAADGMAERAAEDERAYQTAWRAGSDYAEKGEEMAELRNQIKEDLAARRKVREDMQRAGLDTTSREWARCCNMMRSRVSDALQRIARLRASRAVLAAGDAHRRIFFPNEGARAAFNEGAGETVLA